MKEAVLHSKYVVDDPSTLISDLNKLGHYKQTDLHLTDSGSGSGCQDEPVPIVTTAAALPIKVATAIVPIVTTAAIPPLADSAIFVQQAITTAIFIPPTTTTIAAPIVVFPVEDASIAIGAPPVVTTAVPLPTKFIPDTTHSGTDGANTDSGNSGNQGGKTVSDTATGATEGASGNLGGNISGHSGNESNTGNTKTDAVTSPIKPDSPDFGSDAQNPVKSATAVIQQTTAPLPNTDLSQVTSARAQAIVASVLSISASFGPVDATELQNSLVSIGKDIVPGAA
ncbi:hypothetical protein HDU99_004303, partial [Rhizoclosmatium hyalinum]